MPFVAFRDKGYEINSLDFRDGKSFNHPENLLHGKSFNRAEESTWVCTQLNKILILLCLL